MEGTFHDLLIEPTEEGISKAGLLLRSGQLVAFPTETVYGLGANALDVHAVLSIFEAKGRPLTDPLIVHVANPEESYKLIDVSPEEKEIFSALIDSFWPGPLTLICKASSLIPLPVTANTGLVGIRCPKHDLARQLIAAAGVPIAAPSANRFGHVSPTKAMHVIYDLQHKRVKVLNGESENIINSSNTSSCEYGIESSVVKVDGEHCQLIVFRQGKVTQTMLEKRLVELYKTGIICKEWSVVAMQRQVKMHSSNNNDTKAEDSTEGQEAPGQAITHYAPDVPCYILIEEDETSLTEVLSFTLNDEELATRTVIIDYGGKLQHLNSRVLGYRDLSSTGDISAAAYNLFDTLRWAEQVPSASKIFITKIVNNSNGHNHDEDITLGVIDRIFRAASGIHAKMHFI